MRLNKKKLAALAMSAVMAASTMSFPAFAEEIPAGEEMVFADEELVVDEAEVLDLDVEEEVQAPETVMTESEAGVEGTVKDVKFYVDPSADAPTKAWVEYTYGTENKKQDVTIPDLSNLKATCTKDATYTLTAVIEGKTYNSTFVKEKATGHEADTSKWTLLENEFETIKSATCTESGSGHPIIACPKCGGKEEGGKKTDEDTTIVIPAMDHDFGSNPTTTKYVNAYNVETNEDGTVKFVDGKPQLKDATYSGRYDKVVTGTCARCGKKDVSKTETIVVAPTEAGYGEIINSVNIKSGLPAKGEFNTRAEALEAVKKVVLDDCGKDGLFTVEWYDNRGIKMYTEDFKIAARHAETSEIQWVKGKKNCVEVEVEPGVKEWVNYSCGAEASYKKVTKCSTCDKVLATETVTLEPKGKHTLSDVPELRKYVEDGKTVAVEDIKNYIQDDDKYVVLGDTTATCVADGVTPVKLICKVCGKEVETLDIKTKALGHDFTGSATRHDITEATCEHGGTYDVAVYCSRKGCDAYDPDSVRHYTTKRLDHTNEGQGKDKNAYIKVFGNKVIDYDDVEPIKVGDVYEEYIGTSHLGAGYLKAGVYTNCTMCKNHEVPVTGNDDVEIKVVALQKEDKDGLNGSITLDFTVYNRADSKTIELKNQTFPYYSSWAVYMGRPDHDGKDGLTKDEDGIYRLYKNDVFQEKYTGLVDYYDGTFYVENGVLNKVNGLKKVDAEYFYLSNGQVQKKYTGLVKFEGSWFYVTAGKLDTGMNGLVEYQGGKFVFSQGRLRDDLSGLWFYNMDNEWYYLSHGQVQTKHTGVVFYNGAAFYVVNGVLARNMNDVVTYNGKQFKVTNGRLSSRPIK